MPAPERAALPRSTWRSAATDACYACAPVPVDATTLEDFCAPATRRCSRRCPRRRSRRHFAALLRRICAARGRDADNLAELVTFARRRYEASAGTDYLELPVTPLARTRAFARVRRRHRARAPSEFADVLQRRARRRTARATGSASAAQPFPDLRRRGRPGRAAVLAARRHGARRGLGAPRGRRVASCVDGEPLLALRRSDAPSRRVARPSTGCCSRRRRSRSRCSTGCSWRDLFIHGIGGGRYDRVTDGVIRRFYGVEPPAFAVASMTMYLPLGAHVVTEEEVERGRAAAQPPRAQPGPAARRGGVRLGRGAARGRARWLPRRRGSSPRSPRPDADKKALGARIREVNARARRAARAARRRAASASSSRLKSPASRRPTS